MAGRGEARQPVSVKRPGKAAKGAAAGAKQPVAQPKAAPRRQVQSIGQKKSQKAPLIAKSPKTKVAKQAIADAVLAELRQAYPDAHCELDFRDAFELLCATILSAQCTDVRVNMVTPVLFARYPDSTALAAADHADVEEIIRSTGFFRAKARSLIGMAGALESRFGGAVPTTIADLTTLPGVGRKTANVVLGNAFDINEGIVVDTHVQRLSRRLGLTREADPIGIEKELMPLFPRDSWALLSHLLIWHGRRVCAARKPACDGCVVAAVCPSAGME